MKPGRRSVEDLITKPSAFPMRLLQPPPSLDATEAQAFSQLVASCAADHFVQSDTALLVSFVRSTLLAERAAKRMRRDVTFVAVWEKATRMQATLATRLRLAPQARSDPKTIARHAATHRPSAYDQPWPWEATNGN